MHKKNAFKLFQFPSFLGLLLNPKKCPISWFTFQQPHLHMAALADWLQEITLKNQMETKNLQQL